MRVVNVMACDLAKSADFGTLAAVRAEDRVYTLAGLDRWRGRSYVAVARMLDRACRRPEMAGGMLVIDAGGVGVAVVDQLVELRPPVRLVPVISTSGRSVGKSPGGYFTVPKAHLVAALVTVLSEGRFVTPPGLALLDEFQKELGNFGYKLTQAARMKLEAQAGHDDLVSAAALAAWLLENLPPVHDGPLVHWPPAPEIAQDAPGGHDFPGWLQEPPLPPEAARSDPGESEAVREAREQIEALFGPIRQRFD